MWKILLLLLLVVTIACFASTKVGIFNQPIPKNLQIFIDKSVVNTNFNYSKITYTSLNEIKKMLYQHSDKLSMNVINTVLTTITCSKDPYLQYITILTIIDYSLPSNQKRLWIFDVKKKKLLFYTYVSHGITSGTLATTYFSNKINSKASSIGVYYTEQSYFGRHGLSLRLKGLDVGFNHNANRRSIVMHAAWYVNKNFIEKYGRIGRSWGCPAVPSNLIKPIINTIKDKTLFVIYYPSNEWFLKSKFLKCDNLSLAKRVKNLIIMPNTQAKDNRGSILFVDKNNNNKREEYEPILVITVENYKRLFNGTVPLKRMLRRQLNNTEYIALNNTELKAMDTNRDKIINHEDKDGLYALDFVIAVVIKRRGYYATEFRSVNLGNLKEIQLINFNSSDNNQQMQNKKIIFTKNPAMNLKQTKHFIRWLGL